MGETFIDKVFSSSSEKEGLTLHPTVVGVLAGVVMVLIGIAATFIPSLVFRLAVALVGPAFILYFIFVVEVED